MVAVDNDSDKTRLDDAALDHMELPTLRDILVSRRDQLAFEMEDGRRRSLNEDSFAALAGEVADAGDAATAAEQSDLRNTQIERDAGEVRQIDAALERITEGTYGTCVQCEQPVGAARLHATPFAARCIDCQSAYERLYAGTATPTL